MFSRSAPGPRLPGFKRSLLSLSRWPSCPPTSPPARPPALLPPQRKPVPPLFRYLLLPLESHPERGQPVLGLPCPSKDKSERVLCREGISRTTRRDSTCIILQGTGNRKDKEMWVRPLYMGRSVFQKSKTIPAAPSPLPQPQDGPETLSLLGVAFLTSYLVTYQDLTLVY